MPGDHAAVRRSSATPASSATRSASAHRVTPRLDGLGVRRAGVEPHRGRARDRGERVRLDLDPRGGEHHAEALRRLGVAATISRAAAASASRRSSRGVVPAWSARPVSSTCSRSRAASRVTTPAGAPTRRGPASGRCAARGSRAAARATPARRRSRPGRPPAAIASPSATPCSSTRSSTSSTSSRPTSAREPNVGVLKRAPSSSANEITATGTSLGHRERGGHAERAVEPPAAAHAVEVRAGRPPRAGRVRAPPTGCPRGRAPSAGPIASAGGRTSPRPPRPRASRPAGSCRRLVEPDRDQVGEQLARGRRRRSSDATRPRAMTLRTGLWPNR